MIELGEYKTDEKETPCGRTEPDNAPVSNKCNALPSYVPTATNALAKAGSRTRFRKQWISSKLRAHFASFANIYPPPSRVLATDCTGVLAAAVTDRSPAG